MHYKPGQLNNLWSGDRDGFPVKLGCVRLIKAKGVYVGRSVLEEKQKGQEKES